MEIFFLTLFLSACGALVLWGLWKPIRVYQYPFLMGAIFTAFLAPQAMALVQNPDPTIPASAVNQALFMGALCLFMAWLGYQFPPLKRLKKGIPSPLILKRVKLAAFVTMLVTLAAVYGMMGISPEEIRSGTGFFTILAFFSSLAAISFPIFLYFAIRKPSFLSIGLAVVSGYPLYSAVFLAGRREATAEFFIVIAMILFFHRRILPPRWLTAGAVVLVLFLIPVFAAMREDFWHAIWSANLSAIPWKASLDKVLSGDVLELRNAAAVIHSVTVTGNFGFGTGYWDALIFRYVPGQLVGFDLKQALQFNWGAGVYEAIGYSSSPGATRTAIADTFEQLWYFGSLFFFLQGFLFKNIWYLATFKHSFIAQIAYVALVTPALTGVTHGSAWFLQGSLVIILTLLLIYLFARGWKGRRKYYGSSFSHAGALGDRVPRHLSGNE